MNYKLAKQLKEAGYPQLKTGGRYGDKNGESPIPGFTATEDVVLFPTLSELIDACMKFIKEEGSLMSSYNPFMSINKRFWVCVDGKNGIVAESVGKEYEIAVAKLYIKLNEK